MKINFFTLIFSLLNDIRDATVHVRSVNVQKAKMQPTNVRPKQTLTDKKEV